MAPHPTHRDLLERNCTLLNSLFAPSTNYFEQWAWISIPSAGTGVGTLTSLNPHSGLTCEVLLTSDPCRSFLTWNVAIHLAQSQPALYRFPWRRLRRRHHRERKSVHSVRNTHTSLLAS